MRRTLRTGCSSVVLALLALAACGDNNRAAGDAAPEPDGPLEQDAAVALDSHTEIPTAPPMITLTGTAIRRTTSGASPVPGAVIAGYKNTDDVNPVAMTTTDAQGNFTLTVATGGFALDGYLKATKVDFLDTYLYPPAPIAADTVAPINMVEVVSLTLLTALTNVTQQQGNGIIALVVVNGATAQSMPIAGAAVSSVPASGAYRYSNPQSGLPGHELYTQTHTDGVAYLFNVPGNAVVSVRATKAGTTFESHNVKAWANQLTTTLITPAP